MAECICFVTDEKYWFRHYGAVEPGSQMEPNPDCRVHFPVEAVEPDTRLPHVAV